MRECEAVHDVEWEIRLLKRLSSGSNEFAFLTLRSLETSLYHVMRRNPALKWPILLLSSKLLCLIRMRSISF